METIDMTQFLDLSKDAPMLDLTKESPSLRLLRGNLNWDMHPVHGANLNDGFDLDIFVFSLNSQFKISGPQDVIYFKNKVLAAGAVSIPIDNRTGSGDNDEYVDFTLDKIPSNVAALDIYVFIHEAEKRAQRFDMMSNAHFNLIDNESKAVLADYRISQFTNETALHVGRLLRSDSGWSFEAYGEASKVDPNQVVPYYM